MELVQEVEGRPCGEWKRGEHLLGWMWRRVRAEVEARGSVEGRNECSGNTNSSRGCERVSKK